MRFRVQEGRERKNRKLSWIGVVQRVRALRLISIPWNILCTYTNTCVNYVIMLERAM
jgi:hypothetical protein